MTVSDKVHKYWIKRKQQHGTVKQLVEDFKDELESMKGHQYNTRLERLGKLKKGLLKNKYSYLDLELSSEDFSLGQKPRTFFIWWKSRQVTIHTAQHFMWTCGTIPE